MFRDRVLGLLAQSMGDLDQAASHFEDAVEFCRESGYRPQFGVVVRRSRRTATRT